MDAVNLNRRVIIAGGRDYDNWALFHSYIEQLLPANSSPTIISGGANGVDSFAIKYAKLYNIPLEVFPADWDKHGKRAGFIRNTEMANVATELIVFWDGKSKGTEHMISIAKSKNLKITNIEY